RYLHSFPTRRASDLTASWTHFIAVSKSTISPLRTPRDGAWPTPRIFNAPSGRVSPTTTQIFDVPISKQTIRSLLAILFTFSLKFAVPALPPESRLTTERDVISHVWPAASVMPGPELPS